MFFQSLFFACGGAVMFQNGELIQNSYDTNTVDEFNSSNYWVIIEFAGCGTAMFLYVSPPL